MPTPVFLQGRWVERDDARVSAFDAGFLHSVGLFETMAARLDPPPPGSDQPLPSIARLDLHLARLERSAKDLGLTESLHTGPIADAALETVRRAALPRARLRLTLTGGDLNLLEAAARPQHAPTLLITASPATVYPDAMFDRGVHVTIADARANPLDPTAGHKTLNYWWRLRELQHAAARGAAEALVLQITNHLAGGCVSNIFLVKDGSVSTPIARGEEQAAAASPAKAALPSPVLPGTTRAAVLAHLESLGIPTHRRMLSVDDVLDADEVFLTNASWRILPIVRVEAATIADGSVGPLTRDLHNALKDTP